MIPLLALASAIVDQSDGQDTGFSATSEHAADECSRSRNVRLAHAREGTIPRRRSGRDAEAVTGSPNRLRQFCPLCSHVALDSGVPCSTAFAFVSELDSRSRPRRKKSVLGAKRLNARLFVCRQDELVILEQAALRGFFLQGENALGLARKIGIPCKYPAPALPGSKGILGEPAPYRGASDRGSNPRLPSRRRGIPPAPSEERHAQRRWQPAGERPSLNDPVCGKKPRDNPGEMLLQPSWASLIKSLAPQPKNLSSRLRRQAISVFSTPLRPSKNILAHWT